MPPKGKKATSKTAKRPRDSADSQSEDDAKPQGGLQRPVTVAENPESDSNEEATASSDQDEKQARESVQRMFQELQGVLTKSYLAKRKQFRKDVSTSVELLNKKLLYVFKTQQKERQMLRFKYSQMFGPLFQQWEQDVRKMAQEEESSVSATSRQSEILRQVAMAQRETIDEAKSIYDQFLKNIRVLEENTQSLNAIEQSRMETEIENLRKTLITEKQHQDLRALQTCLHSLFSGDCREKSCDPILCDIPRISATL